MADFRFTNEHTTKTTGQIMDVLRQPRLWIPSQTDYPDFDRWLDKTEAALAEGTTRALSAELNAQPVGAVIYKAHDTDASILQIKNISLTPDARGRHVGSFVVRNVEIEAARNDFPDCTQVTVDTKISNPGMISFLLAVGYKLSGVEDLYGLNGGLDAVFTKPLSAN